MKTVLLGVALLLVTTGASAARFGQVGRPADLPQDAAGRDRIECQSVATSASESKQACLTAGQRMTAAGNAEAAASQKALSDRAVRASRTAAGIAQDESAR
ncbi:hypothetical protein [Lysobacter xanthus]